MIEAKTNKLGLNVVNILNTQTTVTPLQGVINIISDRMNEKTLKKPLFIVTAYSETFLEKETNADFNKALDKADLIVGDGVSVWAAADFMEDKLGWLGDLLRGFKIGINVLTGKYAQRAVGVEIFTQMMGEKKYKKFLLGGFNGVAGRLAEKYSCEWSEEDPKIIEKINKYSPDILFVAFGRYKQEIWIAQNLDKLKAKVVIGVGSSFDELAGEGMWKDKVPGWVNKMGLKWLWRVFKDKKHLQRAWRAFPVFPLKVYMWWETRKA